MRQQCLTGYVLHQKPYQENRSLLSLFSAEFGMVHGVGKKNLPLFVPLQVFASGKHSLKTFSQSQALATVQPLVGQALYVGMYLNELLAKLLPLEEPMPAVWHAYADSLTQLGTWQAQGADANTLKWQLRWFETQVLNELGYGIDFCHTPDGDALAPNTRYQYRLQHGFVPTSAKGQLPTKTGKDLTGKELATWQHWLVDTAQFAQAYQTDAPATIQLLNNIGQVYRAIIDHLLGYQPLQSRNLWRSLQRLSQH